MNNLSAARGDSKGEINLHWDSVESAVSYKIEIASPGNSKQIKWRVLDIISDPVYTVKKLRSNTDYFFRVASINKEGLTKLSKKIIKMAP